MGNTRVIECYNCDEELHINIRLREYSSNGEAFEMVLSDGCWYYTCHACNEWGECLDPSDPDTWKYLAEGE